MRICRAVVAASAAGFFGAIIILLGSHFQSTKTEFLQHLQDRTLEMLRQLESELDVMHANGNLNESGNGYDFQCFSFTYS
jgi:hypothetical protein